MTTPLIQPDAPANNVFAVLHVEGSEKPVFCGLTCLPIHNEAEVCHTVLSMFPRVRRLALAVLGGNALTPDYLRACGGVLKFSEKDKNQAPLAIPTPPPRVQLAKKGLKTPKRPKSRISPKRGHSKRKQPKAKTKRSLRTARKSR